MRIGILGGTFDPPHLGHLAIAKAALGALNLDEVVFMPAAKNPLKRGARGTPARHRLEMVRRLIENEPNMAVSDLELTRGGNSYAVDTMAELQMARPADYWFLMGSDAISHIGSWKQPERLLRLCRLGLVQRGTKTLEDVLGLLPINLKDHTDFIEMPHVDTASSELRNKLERGQTVSLWIPPSVREYIQSNKLYRNA